MNLSKIRIGWFLFSIVCAAFAGNLSLKIGSKIVDLTDLLATIISILIGVSLAISAVLSSRPAVKTSVPSVPLTRLQRELSLQDRKLFNGQMFIFLIYYFSLILAVLVKIASLYDENFMQSTGGKIIAVLFIFISTFSLLWSITLPFMLRAIIKQRESIS